MYLQISWRIVFLWQLELYGVKGIAYTITGSGLSLQQITICDCNKSQNCNSLFDSHFKYACEIWAQNKNSKN